jgi:response regulator NasT
MSMHSGFRPRRTLELAMTKSLRIVLADDERDTREYLQELLSRWGHQVAAAGSGRQLAELCRAVNPDLVITDVRMPDLDGIEAALQVNRDREVPVILVSAFHDPALLARAAAPHIMAYLTKPIKEADLQAAVALALQRFEHYRTARAEVASLRQALEDRKLVERAKGIIMRRLGVEEAEAYRRLRQFASGRNRKLPEVAQLILNAEEMFAALEGV